MMKNIILLLPLLITFSSCKSTKKKEVLDTSAVNTITHISNDYYVSNKAPLEPHMLIKLLIRTNANTWK